MQIMKEIVEAYHARNVKVYFVRLKEKPLKLFRQSGLLRLVGEDHLFRKVSEAIEAIEKDRTHRGIVASQS